MKAKHTPGPWKISHSGIMPYVHIGSVAIRVNPSMYVEAEDDANAHLIAAAPELLDACKLALNAFEKNQCIDWNILSKAISKAEGK